MGGSSNGFTHQVVNEIAAMAQTIEELKQREASLRAIIDNTPDQVIKYDRGLHRIYVNPAVAALYGLPMEKLIGKPIGSVIDDARLNVSCSQLEQVVQNIKRVFETGKTLDFEFQWPMPGGPRYLNVHLFPELDQHGCIVSVVGVSRDITELRRTAEDLAKQNEILQKIIDHIPVMICFFEADGTIKLVNREWERWRGWTLEEIRSGKVDIIKDGYPNPEYLAKIRRSIAESNGKWVDLKTRVRDGRYRDGTWAVVRLSDGTRIGIGQDVTERRKAERTLRETHERLEMILDSMTDRFFAFDRNWRVTHFNKDAAEQLKQLGKDPAAFIGKIIWDEFPNSPYEESFRRAMRERVSITHEHYEPRLREWLENRIYPSSDGGVAVFQRYITERKRAEEELRRSEAYLAEGQRLSHTGSWARNVVTGEVFWSLEMFRIFGFDPSTEPTHEKLLALIHPDDRVVIEHTIDGATREKSHYEIDFRIVRPDGAIRHIHSVAHPVFGSDKELREFVGTVVDTTIQRQAEEERMQLLHRIITTQEEERHRIACELHDGMGQYVAALNLGLKNLSAASNLPASLKPRITKLEDLTKEFSQQIRHAALELRPTVLDDFGLQTALANYVDDWSKRNEITVEFHNTVPLDQRLPPHIETALYRLAQEALNNVLKHSRANLVTVILEYSRNSVVMIVEDGGIGFDLDSAFTPSVESRGLGLTIMRERIESVGGKLEIESRPENGTVVAARVPVQSIHYEKDQSSNS
jgi:PAS domain S-box-containing protein